MFWGMVARWKGISKARLFFSFEISLYTCQSSPRTMHIGVQAFFFPFFFLFRLETLSPSFLARARRSSRLLSVLHNTSGLLHFTLSGEPHCWASARPSLPQRDD